MLVRLSVADCETLVDAVVDALVEALVLCVLVADEVPLVEAEVDMVDVMLEDTVLVTDVVALVNEHMLTRCWPTQHTKTTQICMLHLRPTMAVTPGWQRFKTAIFGPAGGNRTTPYMFRTSNTPFALMIIARLRASAA